MGVIPFPEPQPQPENLFDAILGPFVGPIFTAITALIPEGMTVGDALEEVAKVPLRDVLRALDLLPPAEEAS